LRRRACGNENGGGDMTDTKYLEWLKECLESYEATVRYHENALKLAHEQIERFTKLIEENSK
jgi:hypothetical protein